MELSNVGLIAGECSSDESLDVDAWAESGDVAVRGPYRACDGHDYLLRRTELLRFHFEVRFFFGLYLLQELVNALRGFADRIGGNLSNFLAR